MEFQSGESAKNAGGKKKMKEKAGIEFHFGELPPEMFEMSPE